MDGAPIVTPEQFAPPPEQKIEIQSEIEQPAAEVEPEPENFDMFAESAEMTIAAEENETFAEADKKIENAKDSFELPREQAESMFDKGGFSDRIAAIKNRITELIRGTKAEIGSIKGQAKIEIASSGDLSGEAKQPISEISPGSMVEASKEDWVKIIDEGGDALRRMRNPADSGKEFTHDVQNDPEYKKMIQQWEVGKRLGDFEAGRENTQEIPDVAGVESPITGESAHESETELVQDISSSPESPMAENAEGREKPIFQLEVESYEKLSEDPEKAAYDTMWNRFDPSLSFEEKQEQMAKMTQEYRLYKEGKDWKTKTQASESVSKTESRNASPEDLAAQAAEGVANAEATVRPASEKSETENLEKRNDSVSEKKGEKTENDGKEKSPMKKAVEKAVKEAKPEKIERKLSKELIEKIENFPYLSDQDKAVFILTAEGIKPAGFVSLSQQAYSPESMQQAIQETEALVAEAGLSHETKNLYIATQNGEREPLSTNVIFSSDHNVLGELSKEFEQGDVNKQNHKHVGELLGFPKTAVESFEKNETLASEELDLPPEIKYDEALDLAPFTMSREHWQEEYPVIKQWAENLKETSPEVYRRLTSLREAVNKLKNGYPENWRSFVSDYDMDVIQHRDPRLYEELTAEKQ